MFTLVRRRDLVLAVVALAGAAAGGALAIAKAFGLAGPVPFWLGIVVVIVAIVPAALSQIYSVRDRQSRQAESLAAVLTVPLQPVGEVNPFKIGVFPSALAMTAQREGQNTVPPYVSRDVDVPLHRALGELSLAASGRLVVLRGDPKSGKSRSLWEAVRTLPGRRLLAVTQPDPAASGQPASAPLATLAGLDRPVSRSKGRDLVIWVDDAHAHLQRGMGRDNLRQLAALYPGAVIAMTIHSHELDRLRGIDPPLHALLRTPFDDLIVEPELNDGELNRARFAYPALSGDRDLVRLPELFAAVNLLTERYQSHRADQPTGVAVAKAAIDWQRAGMPPGSIDGPTLQALAALTLAGIAPNQILDERGFKRGLEWATEEVAAFAALVRREPPRDTQVPRFRAFDALVSWAQRHEAPVGHETWKFVVAHGGDADLLDVAAAAYLAAEPDTAIDAFQRASGSASSAVAAVALFNKGVILGELGRTGDALAAYDQVVERFGDADDPAVAEYVARALVNKGMRLGTLGRPEDELAAYDQIVVRFGDARDPALAHRVAKALFNKGVTLGELGRAGDAIAAYDQVVERIGDAGDPALAEQAVTALFNKGVRLGALGRPEDELAAYDQIVVRFGDARDPALAHRVAKALFNKGVTLGELGRADDAIAAYDQIVERFGDADDPALAEQVAMARASKIAQISGFAR